jgi:hypothetical protein
MWSLATEEKRLSNRATHNTYLEVDSFLTQTVQATRLCSKLLLETFVATVIVQWHHYSLKGAKGP